MIKLLLSLTLLILSCGNDSSNRSKVSGTNPKASDSPSSNSQSPNANGEENSQAENEEESSGPSREDTPQFIVEHAKSTSHTVDSDLVIRKLSVDRT